MSIDKNSRAARQMRSKGKRPVRRRRRSSPWKGIIIAVLLIVAAAAAGAVYYVNHLWNLTADLDVNMDDITSNPNLDIQTEQVQKGFWKVAVFGVDSTDGNLGKGANSDVIIICSINRETGEIKMASVYRDTYLKVGDKNPYRKINEAYARGGPEQAMKALNENLDIAVDDFVAVNWKAVADAINNLGGVDIEVTEAEFKQINGYITSVVENTGVYSQHLKKAGYQHLDGVQAVAYCRLRKMDTDFQRTQRQRAVISQCLEKAKKSDIRVINTVIGVCLPQVAHSFKLDDLLDMGKNINRYYLGDTTGFPFDLKTQNIGKLDCVVPVTLSSNVVKLHQFLFGTENYQPSSHVTKISEDIAYNSAKQADSGEEIHQEDIERMTSAARETSSRGESERETKEEARSESTRSSSETETEESRRDTTQTTKAAENEERNEREEPDESEREDTNSETRESREEDEQGSDPVRRPTETAETSEGTRKPTTGESSSSAIMVPAAPTSGKPAGSTGNSSTGTPGGTNSGSTGNSSTVTPGGSNGEEHSTGSGTSVHTQKPIPTEQETTGIEGGPGFFRQ
ncbi:MAG: LCP family protein [Lachnospiraceae bacterium]|nr:LCP family protein [Lachnospiraceae bacterium]